MLCAFLIFFNILIFYILDIICALSVLCLLDKRKKIAYHITIKENVRPSFLKCMILQMLSKKHQVIHIYVVCNAVPNLTLNWLKYMVSCN